MSWRGRSPALRHGRRPWERVGASRGARGPRRPYWLGRGRLDTQQEGWCAATPHGRHGDISPNTWRASVYTERDSILDPFWTELDHGPKKKFAELGPLYKTRLRYQLSRAID
jgi:hypothetical protein